MLLTVVLADETTEISPVVFEKINLAIRYTNSCTPVAVFLVVEVI